VSPRHLVRASSDESFAVPSGYAEHTRGFRRWPVVDEAVGAVHTGFSIGELDPEGSISHHVHSYEESLFVLEGEVVLRTPGAGARLGPGDYGVIPIGVPHVLRSEGPATARWAAMAAPQPRPAMGGDTYFIPPFVDADDVAIDVRDPRTRSFGHIDPENMDVARQTQDMLAVSASMRTALLVYSGITVKMMIDRELGADQLTMFMVQYQPDGLAGAHDHPFEETYLILEGEVDGTFDGEPYHLRAGDIAWAGVGCVHSFMNPGPWVVRWLETQAPQPPTRHSYRFARDWDYLREHTELE
jgi:quercetin dioxygenase-like cupin family protein